MMVVTTEASPTKMADLSRQVLPSDSITVNHNLTHAPLGHNCRLQQASSVRADCSMRENPCATFSDITARTRRLLIVYEYYSAHRTGTLTFNEV
jgi:hypothetical protein